MKILVVSQYYWPEQFRINEVCEELVRRGHEVTVLTGRPNYPEGEVYLGYENKEQENHNGVNIVRCKIRPRKKGNLNLGLNYLSYMWRANKAIKKISADFDISFVYQMSPVLMAVPAIRYKKRTGCPVYLYCLDIWPESIKDVFKNERSIFYKFVKKVSQVIYNSADHISITSKPFAGYLHDVCKVSEEKISYLPQHAEDVMLMSDIRTIDNGCIDLVFMGNVGYAQDLENVARAVQLVRTEKNFLIHIVGDGSTLKQLKECVKQLGVEEKFVFYGRHPLEDMPYYYCLADACLLTLGNDNATGMTIPGKLQGYMSAGKVVIAAINGAANELILESNCGISVPAGQPKELAKAITRFIENNDQFIDCGKNGRAYFEHFFCLDQHISQLDKELQECVTRKGK